MLIITWYKYIKKIEFFHILATFHIEIYFIQYWWLHILALREPNASQVENSGFGYVVASVGELGGNVPYTAYNAKKSFIENNKEIIKSFKNAINKALKYVNNNSSEDIANSIIGYFPDTSKKDLISAIERYKSIGAWKENISITEEDYSRLEDIMISSGELEEDKRVSYDKLFITD